MDNRKPTLYLIPCNHFDLAWRRTFRVDMKNNGRTFIPYAKIEQYYIEDNIKLCEKYPEYKFCIESFSVLDEYLRRFPKMKEKIVSLAKQGKIFVLGSGYAIIDANMVSGETLVRNFLYGTLEAEELLGQKTGRVFVLTLSETVHNFRRFYAVAKWNTPFSCLMHCLTENIGVESTKAPCLLIISKMWATAEMPLNIHPVPLAKVRVK